MPTDLTLSGEHGVSYQLTGGTIAANPTDTRVVINLDAADQLALAGLLNQNGGEAADWTTYNLSAVSGWDRGNAAITSMGIKVVTNAAAPTISSVSFNAATSVLTVTGNQLVELVSGSGIILNDLTLSTGGASENLGGSGGAIINQTNHGFTVQLDNSYDALFGGNGNSFAGNAYHLSASSGWDAGIGKAVTNQSVNVSGYAINISGVTNSTLPDTSTVEPFRAVTINDDNNADTESATISFTAANGVLSGSGLSAGVVSHGVATYTVDASTASGLLSELQQLVFTPTAHQLAAGKTLNTDVTLSVSGYRAGIMQTLSNGASSPGALATDSHGDVFVTYATAVEEFSASGSLLHTFSNGLSLPDALATDSHGDVFISNQGNNTVLEFNASGTLLHTLSYGLFTPDALAADSRGDVFIASMGAGVEEFSPSGALLHILSNGVYLPVALATDSHGDVFVANNSRNTIEEFSGSGALLRTLSNGVSSPQALATDSYGDVFVGNQSKNTVEEFSSSGSLLRTLSVGVSSPDALATDSHGDVFVAGNGGNAIEEFNASGNLLQTLSFGATSSPQALATDSHGDLFVSNDGNNTVKEITPVSTAITATNTNTNTQITVTATANTLSAVANGSLTNPNIDSTPHTGDLMTIADATRFDSTAISKANVTAANGSIATLAGWAAGAFSASGADIAQHEIAWFQFAGNTYLVEQANTQGTAFGTGDTLIELVGVRNENAAQISGHVLTI